MGFFFENVIFFLGLGYGGIMANGMASLMVGASGLKTSQTALNTTAHNLSNVNTTGYTRQQITFADSTYVNVFGTGNSTGKCGLGVDVDAISRIRNDFIDKSYRTENARLGYYESQNATAFIDRSEAIYAGLKDYQVTLNTDINNMVNKINNLGQKIYDLNKEIAKVESGSGERANDLRDTRDNALDELSGYIDFDYYENEHGEVIVTAENVPFVTSAQVTEMGTRQVDNSALLIPIWPGYDRDVFNLSNINNMKDTDKGELKGLLVARGSIEVNYTDVPVMPEKEDYDFTTADGLQAYNDAMDAYNEKQEYYNKYIEPSAILSAIAGFDKLVNGIVTSLNDILCPEKTIETTKELTDNDGNVLQADEYIYNASVNATLYDR